MRTCFVPGCKSGYNSQREKRALFSVPNDRDLLQKWKRAIPRKDTELSAKCFVCELHFMPEHIVRHNKITMPDGTVYLTKLIHVRLQPGVIPCIFPNLPSYLTSREQRRKLPAPIEYSSKKLKTRAELLAVGAAVGKADNEDAAVGNSTVHTACSDEDPLANIYICQSLFEEIKLNVNGIKIPHSNWVSSVVPGLNVVTFVEWDADFNVTKRVVVGNDLSVKVFFGKVERDCLEKTRLENISDISEILDTVDKMNVN